MSKAWSIQGLSVTCIVTSLQSADSLKATINFTRLDMMASLASQCLTKNLDRLKTYFRRKGQYKNNNDWRTVCAIFYSGMVILKKKSVLTTNHTQTSKNTRKFLEMVARFRTLIALMAWWVYADIQTDQ